MKYIFLIVISLIGILGCDTKTTQVTNDWVLPEELSHCKIYSMKSNGNHMRVVYCPNATTTTFHSCGKNCTTNNTFTSE